MNSTRQRFNLMLVDGPRWDGGAELRLLAACSDAVYLVVAEDEASSPSVNDLLRVLPEGGVPLAGTILTGR